MAEHCMGQHLILRLDVAEGVALRMKRSFFLNTFYWIAQGLLRAYVPANQSYFRRDGQFLLGRRGDPVQTSGSLHWGTTFRS